MYWSFPVTRARPGATVLARHGDPRMQNQYGRHVLLASQLYGPGRTVFIGFDSTYRWRYLAEDYFDGFWARLVDRVGPEQGAGRPVPVPGEPRQDGLPGGRPGRDRGPVHRGRRGGRGVGPGGRARGRRPAPRAAPLREGARRPRPAHRDLPGRDAPAATRSASPRRPGADAGAATRVSTTTFRVEPPRREIDEPSLNRALLADLARLTGGQVLDVAERRQARRRRSRCARSRGPSSSATSSGTRRCFMRSIILGLTAEWIFAQDVPDGLRVRSSRTTAPRDRP